MIRATLPALHAGLGFIVVLGFCYAAAWLATHNHRDWR